MRASDPLLARIDSRTRSGSDARMETTLLARWMGIGSVGLVALAAVAASNACGATNDSNTFGESGGSSSKGSASGQSGGDDSSSGLFDGGPTGSNGSGSSVGGGCAGDNVKAEKLPLDMYIMLDQSGSMEDPVSGGGTKWSAVSAALSAFVQQGAPVAGIGVGLQYFGLPPNGMNMCAAQCMTDADCGAPACGPCLVPVPNFPGICLGGAAAADSCDGADYAKPAIEIAPLPGVAAAITSSIGMHGPSTGTPTYPALQGAVDHAKEWATAHPDHVVIDVFATDGDPSECNTDLNAINALAAAGANGMPKILTFVIGVGNSISALNGIAMAGGTGQAYLVDTNANAQQQFLDALNAIQGTALGCTYSIPMPEAGTPDFDTVNVEYTPGGGGMKQTLPKVANEGACPANGDAWYYDNNASPTKIILCDATCTKVSADATGTVDIVLGCKTILN